MSTSNIFQESMGDRAVVADLSGTGTSSQNCKNLSMKTSRYLLPLVETENSKRASTLTEYRKKAQGPVPTRSPYIADKAGTFVHVQLPLISRRGKK